LMTPVFFEELAQQLAIEVRRIDLFERPRIALLPMTDQVGVELAGVADPALEKSHAQTRKTPRYAAHEDRFANGFAGAREMPDMIVGEIRRRHPETRAAAGAVEGRRQAQLHALGPYRIVIVCAVEAEHVIQHGATALAAPRQRRNRPPDQTAH